MQRVSVTCLCWQTLCSAVLKRSAWAVPQEESSRNVAHCSCYHCQRSQSNVGSCSCASESSSTRFTTACPRLKQFQFNIMLMRAKAISNLRSLREALQIYLNTKNHAPCRRSYGNVSRMPSGSIWSNTHTYLESGEQASCVTATGLRLRIDNLYTVT